MYRHVPSDGLDYDLKPLPAAMEMLSMLKHSLVADGNNPILKDFTLGRQTASCGPEMVWKIFDAVRNKDKKVCYWFCF